ncbi:MAG TPA: tRNA pseudouridine(55) synthase TruB [Lacipirellulaceae bacterium]|nr:tRNA pseudouridine(55) synthase TruB [Lacipirellulaceae bacterium]
MALFGVLNVMKPCGITSRDAVDRVERLVRPAKAGHAGTLDPLATGVLVICVGQATRLIRFVHRMPKTYRAAFLLGRRSNTDDMEGEVHSVEVCPRPAREALDRVLPQFVGEIQQRPPAHSAIKLAGRRAYQLARKGAEFDLAPRTVTVYRLDVRRYEYPELELDIQCGSGTYVRALGRDIGAALGTAAVMSALERTAVGPFRVEQSVVLEDLSRETLDQHLQPALALLSDLPQIEVSDSQFIEIGHGRPIPLPNGVECGATDAKCTEWAAINADGRLVAILAEKKAGQLRPVINFG